MATLKERIAALEQAATPQAGLAERMRQACERWRSKTPEQRAADREARVNWAMTSPAPESGTLRRRLWDAWRRIAGAAARPQ